jgi:endonuclease YncB( thermonuclease family)
MRGWDGVLAAIFAAGCSTAFGVLGAAAQEQPRTSVACGDKAIAPGRVAHVADGRTFTLDDGREVRLAGIEVPPMPLPQESGAAPGGERARDALAAFFSGADVALRQAEPQATDRYGRISAYAFVARDGAERSAQAELVAAGLARVAARVGNRTCAAELLRRETAARTAKLGLWADAYYDLLNADSPADVLAEQGLFALVEGRVASVRESGATIYVNFGRRWTEDFTVTILKRNERTFSAAGLEPKTLAGRHIRVRGWVEERGGPWIEAARPEQIELIDRQ